MQDKTWHLKYYITGSEESHRKSQVSKNNNLNSTVDKCFVKVADVPIP